MKTSILLIILFFSFLFAYSQDPAIIWQNTIGGSDMDQALSIDITSDGGTVIAGTSTSNISGDKTENSNGALDIWVVKLDASGNIQWQNTIGGSGDDYALSISQTSDGGYIVGGSSNSNISGDKTENSRGGLDYWILKLDGSGNISWQKTYGGDQPEFETRVIQTNDGGYFVSGYSDSNIAGDKTDPTNGQRDFWALKLDSSGNIQWQNSIGGNLVDRPFATFQTPDGGYFMAGFSNSDASGDKTENSQGLADYWVVKLDSTGNVVWENTIGGSDIELLRDAIPTSDGGYFIGGYSLSNASGDKTENSQGNYDYWVLKLDGGGNIVWQNTIGGNDIDYLTNLREMPGGELLVTGYSESNISGDKTENSNGGFDLWILKLTSSGILLSQNTLGGSGNESRAFLERFSNGDYVIACTSDSNISGDKGENSEGLDDYWVFKTTSAILGVEENLLSSTFTAYPNPTKGDINISLGKSYSEVDVKIINSLGQILTTEKFNETSDILLNIKEESGIYFVTVKASEGKTTVLKIIKN